MIRLASRIGLVVTALFFFSAGSAFAYQESVDSPSTPLYACPACHGLESGIESPTVAPTRTGPHGGYNVGTSKCQTCHSVHSAPAVSVLMLPAATIVATCNTCHDGTGGGGVYGVIERRTGSQPASHRIEFSVNGMVTVPGGDPEGGSFTRAFTGETGGLTCTDCHSPHGTNVVEDFVGDRVRAVDDTSEAVLTDRLLRQMPYSTEETVAVYGSDWCKACHKGRLGGTMNHPVAGQDTTWTADYMRVQRMESYDSSIVADVRGPLGGSNLGYVIPQGSPGVPICQQCHEDSRSVANDTSRPFVIDGATEAFSAPLDGTVAGNPTFQNFPHETVNPSMLIEERNSLCLNCHYLDSDDAVH